MPTSVCYSVFLVEKANILIVKQRLFRFHYILFFFSPSDLHHGFYLIAQPTTTSRSGDLQWKDLGTVRGQLLWGTGRG